MNILSIQSWVAYGHVGNASAVFPLQRLGAEGLRGPALSNAAVTAGPLRFTGQSLAVYGLTVGFIIALWLFFGYTRTGKALRATAVNRVGARLVGIRPGYTGTLAFLIASLLGGVSGVLIGPVGIYIRNHVDDATPPPATKQESPVAEVFRQQKLATILAIGALAVSTAVNYLIVYMPTYVVKTLNLPPTVGFMAALVAQTAVALLAPIAGFVSDKIGRTTHMILFALLLLVSIFPAFLMLTGKPTPTIIWQSVDEHGSSGHVTILKRSNPNTSRTQSIKQC